MREELFHVVLGVLIPAMQMCEPAGKFAFVLACVLSF